MVFARQRVACEERSDCDGGVSAPSRAGQRGRNEDALSRLFEVKTSKRLSRTIVEFTVWCRSRSQHASSSHSSSHRKDRATHKVRPRHAPRLANDRIDRRVEAVIVLHRESEDRDGAVPKFGGE